ncbi:MAG: hypothetical protein Fur0028_02150 [Bacteroidales bacterium]
MSFYDYYASRNRNSFGVKIKKSFAEKLFVLAFSQKEKPLRILEIGPGDGYIAALAKKHNFDYTGIEGSNEVFNSLKKEGFNIIQAIVPPLPKNIGNYDVCFALHIIEHLNSITEATQFILQIKNKLNKDGKIIIATPDYLKWGKDFYNCDYTHNLPFTVKRLYQLFINENLTIEYVGYYVGDQFGLLRIPIYWLGKLLYLRGIDNFLRNSIRSDIWYRAYLTCLPNIVMIARK